MRRFITNHVPAIGEFVCLDEQVSHHLLRVTGIAPGEKVELFDGSGTGAIAELCDVYDGLARLRILSVRAAVSHLPLLHLCVAQLRASALDTVLRMATELGVTEVTVIQSERCVARGDKQQRWLRIVRSAAAQCGRSDWPTIHPVCRFSAAIALDEGALGIMCDPAAGDEVASVASPTRLLIGPEGGWTDHEKRQAKDAGWILRGLGGNVLRADTAAVAAISRILA